MSYIANQVTEAAKLIPKVVYYSQNSYLQLEQAKLLSGRNTSRIKKVSRN